MQAFINFICEKDNYNRIFANRNLTAETENEWHTNTYGDCGALDIREEDGVFTLTLVVDGQRVEREITAEALAEKVYLYDRFELEGWAMVSINSDKLLEEMLPGKDIDGHYIVVTHENEQRINDLLTKYSEENKEYPEIANSMQIEDLVVLETFV